MTPLIFLLLLLQEKASIEGKVVNAITNEPLPKVRVTMDSGHRYSVTTGADGTFKFESVEPDDYEPIAGRVGFLEADEEDSFEVGPGEHKKGVLIKLMPQGVIAGRVVDEDGDPIAETGVNIERAIQIDGQRKMLDSSWENSNSEGYFFFGDLKPGVYYVRGSQSRRFHRSQRVGDSSDALVPNGPAQMIHLAGGGEFRDVEIRMKSAVVFQVSGRISNQGSDQLYLGNEDNSYKAYRIKDSFVFEGVVPGNYMLTVPPFLWTTSARIFCRIPVTVSDDDVAGIQVELTPGPNVEGSIKMEGGKFERPPKIELQDFSTRLTAEAKEDGSFVWTNISPDKHEFMYAPPEGAYVKSILFNREPVTGNVLDLRAGGGALEILVSPKAATVSATVQGANNVYIGLWNESGFFRQQDTAAGDAATFKSLAPGEYRIAAYAKFAAEFMGFSEFRGRFSAQKISIAEGSSQSVDVELIPKPAIEAEIAKVQ